MTTKKPRLSGHAAIQKDSITLTRNAHIKKYIQVLRFHAGNSMSAHTGFEPECLLVKCDREIAKNGGRNAILDN